jgi:hypothetical protein
LKALVDTNVILDAVAAREPLRQDAEKIILMAAEEKIEGFISAKSVADIYYVARKHMPETAAREALANLFRVFSILAVLGGGGLPVRAHVSDRRLRGRDTGSLRASLGNGLRHYEGREFPEIERACTEPLSCRFYKNVFYMTPKPLRAVKVPGL